MENNSPKLPAANNLEYGELAINYADGHETLSIKNSNNEIATFSSDEVLDQRYLSSNGISALSGSVIALSAATLTSGDVKTQIEGYNYISAYTETDPIFTSSAAHDITSQDITNWNNKISAYTETDPIFTGSAAYNITSGDITNWNSKTDNVGTITGINMNGASKGTSGVVDLGTVLTEHQSLSGYVYSVSYNSTDKKIYFYDKENHQIPTYVDATDFIKDGMVSDVEIATPSTGANSGISCLVVTFNTDAGHEDIEIPISSIFNANNYYTKNDIDNKHYVTSADTKTQIESYHYTTSAETKSQIEGYGYTTNVGTITGINMNGSSKGTSGVVDLGTVLTSFTETQLSTATTGNGNAVTSLSVDNHKITYEKGSTFTTSGDVETQITNKHYVTSANTKTQIEGYNYTTSAATKTQIEGYNYTTSAATKTQIENYHYVTSSDTKTQIENYHYVTSSNTKTQIEGYNYTTSANTKTQIEGYHYVTSSQTKTQIESYNYTTNAGTITGINMNGASKGTSGVVDLGTVLTSFTETQLSTASTGNGNVITGLTVSNHQITTQKGQVDGLPTVSASDNGKILIVSGGTWTMTTPVNIYSGSGLPNNNLGNNGDIYLQTS